MKRLSRVEKLREQALKMDTATLLSELPKLAKRANSRLSYIEQRSVDGESAISLSPAYSDLYKSAMTGKDSLATRLSKNNLPRFKQGGFKNLTPQEQASVYVSLQGFLQSTTSTLKGIRAEFENELQGYANSMEIYRRNLESDIKDIEARLEMHPTASKLEKEYTAQKIAQIQEKIARVSKLTPRQLRELYQSEIWEIMRRELGSDNSFDLLDNLLDHGVSIDDLYNQIKSKSEAQGITLDEVVYEMEERHDLLNPDDFMDWLKE